MGPRRSRIRASIFQLLVTVGSLVHSKNPKTFSGAEDPGITAICRGTFAKAHDCSIEEEHLREGGRNLRIRRTRIQTWHTLRIDMDTV